MLRLLHRDVGGVFDDLVRSAVFAEDRVVARLDPDLLAAFAEAAVLGRLELAAIQLGPEVAVLGAVLVGRLDEHAVMTPLDLLQRVTQRLQEVLVRRDNGSIQLELDHGLRLAERREYSPGIAVEHRRDHGMRLFCCPTSEAPTRPALAPAPLQGSVFSAN
jgi:hypothetical protein